MDYVRSPRQATTVFGLDGNNAPRKKSNFYVRFCRSDPATNTSRNWQDNMGFIVKSIDRPSVQPQLEELNQYNKKRHITTGYQIQPMRVVLYDTSDSMVMRMWNEYAKYYYGDFNHDDRNNSDYSYDITTPEMKGEDIGFGHIPRASSGDDALDLNSGFFFSRIEVYQVFGREYTQFDLINPKIKTFDPDELDYSDYEAATIAMTIAYEAILYRNNSVPMPISSNEYVAAAFNTEFDGGTFDVEGAPRRINQNLVSYGVDPITMDMTDFRPARLPDFTDLGTDSGNTLGSGALSQFGNFDFGSLAPAVRVASGTAGDISYIARSSAPLTTALNLSRTAQNTANPEALALSRAPAGRGVLSSTMIDAAEGALRGAGSKSNDYADAYIAANLVSAVAASQIISGNSGHDQLVPGAGLALNSQSYGVANAQRPAYSQIGYNYSSSSDYTPNGKPANPALSTILGLIDKAV